MQLKKIRYERMIGHFMKFMEIIFIDKWKNKNEVKKLKLI